MNGRGEIGSDKHPHTAESVLNEFRLFTLMTIMQSDDGSRGAAPGGLSGASSEPCRRDSCCCYIYEPRILAAEKIFMDKDGAGHCIIVTARLMCTCYYC